MSYHHKSGAQKRKQKAMLVEGAKGQKTLQQHGFDYRNQYSSLPSTEAMIAPSEIAIEGLSEGQLREQWDAILAESKLVSENIGIDPVLPERRQRKRKRFADESVQDDNEHSNCGQEDHFSNNVFYVLVDSVIGNMTNHNNMIQYMHWSRCLVSYGST